MLENRREAKSRGRDTPRNASSPPVSRPGGLDERLLRTCIVKSRPMAVVRFVRVDRDRGPAPLGRQAGPRVAERTSTSKSRHLRVRELGGPAAPVDHAPRSRPRFRGREACRFRRRRILTTLAMTTDRTLANATPKVGTIRSVHQQLVLTPPPAAGGTWIDTSAKNCSRIT